MWERESGRRDLERGPDESLERPLFFPSGMVPLTHAEGSSCLPAVDFPLHSSSATPELFSVHRLARHDYHERTRGKRHDCWGLLFYHLDTPAKTVGKQKRKTKRQSQAWRDRTKKGRITRTHCVLWLRRPLSSSLAVHDAFRVTRILGKIERFDDVSSHFRAHVNIARWKFLEVPA